jgi:hypothetical protein
MTGFYIFVSRHGERMAFRCGCCFLHTVFAEGEKPRVFHCNRWSEYVEPTGFWNWLLGESLPRVKPQVPVILRRRQENEELQQTGE